MFSSLTNFLIILLTLLQFLAPLVHAHTGETHSSSNIHLPGFEYFSLPADSSPVFQALTVPYYVDASSIISVGSSIQHKKVHTVLTTPDSLSADNFSIKPVSQQYFIKHSPQQQPHIQARHCNLLPARAPPSKF